MGEVKMTQQMAERFQGIRTASPIKPIGAHNPVMIQRYGADPWAFVHDGRVWLYMTGDTPVVNEQGVLEENTYSLINTINVISSADLVNWTDHGSIKAAGAKGAATWGGNSWAPAFAVKKIEGRDRFFLYFANSGNGIAVLTADDPAGPFRDPIGHALISRDTPNCADVTWLFDPAVLVDDDGSAYLYVGGGIPGPDRVSDPGTARVVRLGDDMISLAEDPRPIEGVPYLFEDSGINRIGRKYVYSYCSNFNVSPEAEKEFGFASGEIITMTSDQPRGPFTLRGPVLKNPGTYFGRGGNNHHCIFFFEGEWYIAYHARLLEEGLNLTGGYRSTNIDRMRIAEDGLFAGADGTREGVGQIGAFDPYRETSAVTLGNASGIATRPCGETAEKYGSGTMVLSGLHDGSWTCIYGADFGAEGASRVKLLVRGSGEGAVRLSTGTPDGEICGYVGIDHPGRDFVWITAELDRRPQGKQDLYMTFAGSGYELLAWEFMA